MSMQTTEAAAAASRARAAWREHLNDCVPCSSRRHQRGRRRGAMCPDGVQLRAGLVDAENWLEAERAADRRPLPGQAELPLNLPGQLELYGDVLP